MNYKKIEVKTELEACELFANFSYDYQQDTDILIEFVRKYFRDNGFSEPANPLIYCKSVWRYVQSKYIIDPGPDEVIIRPNYYYIRGGDCTNQAIVFMALLSRIGILREREQVMLNIAKGPYDAEYGHIFLSIGNFSLSALPGESINNWNYKMRQYDIKELL